MKKALLFSLLLLCSSFLQAQKAKADSLLLYMTQIENRDSLEQLLAQPAEDTIRTLQLGNLAWILSFVNPEKGLEYGLQGLRLARAVDYKKGTAYCNLSSSFCLIWMGNYTQAYQLAVNALRQYEDLDDEVWEGYTYLALANVHREIGDYNRALADAYKGLAIYQRFGLQPKVPLAIIGSIYERQGRLDSALVNMQRAYELDVLHNSGQWGWPVSVLGNIQARMKHYDVALAHYKVAIGLALKNGFPKDIVDIYNSIANVHLLTGKPDSARVYANEILQRWNTTSYKRGMLQAVNTLAGIYQAKNERDSTIKYLQWSVALNQELFAQEKERAFQNLAFNEELRRQEKAYADQQAAKARKQNLQLLAIAAFLITFMVAVILISRKRSLARTARFLGLIGVLLVFEFISLLLHPWVGSLTHHQPVWTLLVLVLLASILVPAHHYLEGLVRKKLVAKRRTKRTPITSTRAHS